MNKFKPYLFISLGIFIISFLIALISGVHWFSIIVRSIINAVVFSSIAYVVYNYIIIKYLIADNGVVNDDSNMEFKKKTENTEFSNDVGTNINIEIGEDNGNISNYEDIKDFNGDQLPSLENFSNFELNKDSISESQLQLHKHPKHNKDDDFESSYGSKKSKDDDIDSADRSNPISKNNFKKEIEKVGDTKIMAEAIKTTLAKK